MNPDDIRPWLRKRPFVPYRVFLKDGRQFDAMYAGMQGMGPNHLHCGLAPADGSSPWSEKIVIVPYEDVDKIEIIENPKLHPKLASLNRDRSN